ncbi:MAG: 30S ribosomal protein S6e [Nanoarchaeota archaeon]|nr:30S ribosomal protein S6e [Nanoarchaeota archaeon]MBU0962303.1 30S ribosomal protein S6e [Nanoarchaeota archaeon]
MEIKSVICLKNGKSYPKLIDNTNLINKKLGDKLEGSLIGLSGLELEITGGSDNSGFPMRADIPSASRKRILTSTKSVGIKIKQKGCKIRKSVCGGIISNDTAQVNFKVIKGDAEKHFKTEEKKEEAKEEVKKDEKAETKESPKEKKE